MKPLRILFYVNVFYFQLKIKQSKALNIITTGTGTALDLYGQLVGTGTYAGACPAGAGGSTFLRLVPLPWKAGGRAEETEGKSET